jgi:hypothetical protein
MLLHVGKIYEEQVAVFSPLEMEELFDGVALDNVFARGIEHDNTSTISSFLDGPGNESLPKLISKKWLERIQLKSRHLQIHP